MESLFKSTEIGKFTLKPSGSLFEPKWFEIKNGLCPLCGWKLKKMYLKPLLYCKNKQHDRKVFKTDKIST